MPASKAQVRLAYAVLNGKSNAMSKSAAREIIEKWEKMTKRSRKRLPERKKRKKRKKRK